VVSFNNNLNTCRKVSAEMSKQFRIVPVDSKTRDTPISRHFEKILCPIHNRLLPILNKILDNGRIPTGRQVDEVLEEVIVMYYKQMKTEGAKADSADPDEDDEGVVLSSQMEDFHPHEYYIFCEWGPTVIGGRGHVNFLKNTEDMEESLGNAGSREKFRRKKCSDEDEKVVKAKKMALSETLFNGNTPPSPGGSSISSSNRQSSKIQELALKKLQHDIFKSQEDAKTNLRPTLAEKVVCDAPCAPPVLVCLVLFLLLTNNRFVHRR
jgi:hypothetical protein